MLTKIREKTQGAFAAGILLLIGVPFVLWGINNYIDNAREVPVASVGNKDFFQRDINKAYEQFSQSLRGLGIDEQYLKAQALNKLIKDEVLLQYVNHQGLAVTDNNVREFIKSLDYFQTNGKFDDNKFKSLLAAQHLTSNEFISRIKNALLMQQFQTSIVNSSFATTYDIERFFSIQNQQRDVEYVTLGLQPVTQKPTEQEIADYYQQHQSDYQIPEQTSIQYIHVTLNDVASKVVVTEDKLKAYYDEQKDQYTVPERRKISHILVAIDSKTDDKAAFAKIEKIKQDLSGKDFSQLAKDYSDDKATAKLGGDLGLFNAGVMEPAFEKAATSLKLNQVSDPIKTSFGYHLIKVTELVPGEIKPFTAVKDEVTKAYQKNQAENAFYELGEKLTEMSYENPDNLQVVADNLGLEIKKTGFFSKDKGEGIAAEDKIRSTAFSEEVQHGNNSSPIELGTDNLVVLRQLEHKAAATRELSEVKAEVSNVLEKIKSKTQAIEKAKEIKKRLQSGISLATIASENKLEIKQYKALTRNKTDVPQALLQAIFTAAKPVADKPSFFIEPMPTGEQVIVSLSKVTDGVMTDSEKKQMSLAEKNLANAFGESEFNAVINSLQSNADITIHNKAKQAE